jgi:hypothetical protein
MDDQPHHTISRPSRPSIPLYTGLALALIQSVQIVLQFHLSMTWWYKEHLFYPFIWFYRPGVQLGLNSFIIILIIFGLWWLSRSRRLLGLELFFVVPFVGLLTVGCGCWWLISGFRVGNELTPADSIYHDTHTYRLILETHDNDSLYAYNTFIVYRCDRFGLFCNTIYDSAYVLTGAPHPEIQATQSGDLRFALDDAGRLYIHYYDEVLFVTDTGE